MSKVNFQCSFYLFEFFNVKTDASSLWAWFDFSHNQGINYYYTLTSITLYVYTLSWTKIPRPHSGPAASSAPTGQNTAFLFLLSRNSRWISSPSPHVLHTFSWDTNGNATDSLFIHGTTSSDVFFFFSLLPPDRIFLEKQERAFIVPKLHIAKKGLEIIFSRSEAS